MAAKLRRDGWGVYDIADKLGVAPSMVTQYVATYYRELRAEGKGAAEEARDLDLARVDDSLKDVEMCLAALRVDAKQGEREAAQTIARLTDTKCKLLDRRAKLMGTDAPAKSEVTGKDGAPLQGDLTPAMMRSFVEEQFGRVGPKDAAPEAEPTQAPED
jgi:predicted transcriptional regulator